MTAETISRPRRSRRWRYLIAAVAVAGAYFVVASVRMSLRPSTAEASPKAEGYTAVGSIDGVNFWLQVRGPNEVGFRTTGRMGGICNDDTPYAAALGPYAVCAQSIQAVGSVFAFIVPDTVHDMSLPLSTGATVTASGSLPLDTLVAGHHLLVAVLPLAKNQPIVSMSGLGVFS
jgi:hypothetical protein